MYGKKNVEQRYKSATHYILASLVPYTEANLKLSFKPHAFFDDLERLDRYADYKRSSLEVSYHRAVKKGLIDTSGRHPSLTEGGERKLEKYQPKVLGEGARLLLIFDIPEDERVKRNRLRALLRELKFTYVQQSVWATKYDVLDYLRDEITANGLQAYVKLYESSPITL